MKGISKELEGHRRQTLPHMRRGHEKVRGRTGMALTPQLAHALVRMWRHVVLKLPPDAGRNTLDRLLPQDCFLHARAWA